MLASVLALVLTPQAWAQHRHDQGHSIYSGWVNQKEEMCCSDKTAALWKTWRSVGTATGSNSS